MARYSVPMTTWASTVVEVDVPDDVTDPEQIAELALQQNNPPTLCASCSGGRRSGYQELQLGDDWEPSTFNGKPSITRLD